MFGLVITIASSPLSISFDFGDRYFLIDGLFSSITATNQRFLATLFGRDGVTSVSASENTTNRKHYVILVFSYFMMQNGGLVWLCDGMQAAAYC